MTVILENVFESPVQFLVGKKYFAIWLRESNLDNETKFGSSSGKQQITGHYRTHRSGAPWGVSPLIYFSKDKQIKHLAIQKQFIRTVNKNLQNLKPRITVSFDLVFYCSSCNKKRLGKVIIFLPLFMLFSSYLHLRWEKIYREKIYIWKINSDVQLYTASALS